MPSEEESCGIQYEIQCEKDGHERTYLREQLAEAKLYIVNLQETLKLKGAADAVSMPPIPLVVSINLPARATHGAMTHDKSYMPPLPGTYLFMGSLS
jgi:hypothetical protein